MSKDRRGGRDLHTHRPIEATTGFHRLAEGSVLYRTGGTSVLVTASIEEFVPRFLEGSGQGWLTAEYQMHPRSGPKRRESRDGRGRALSGRAKEIERLIGRSLRAAIDLKNLGERCIHIDCDVLEADGGTRTASISGGFIALAIALQKLYTKGKLHKPPLHDQVAAVSVGLVDGEIALDLCYAEDSIARVDLNAVATPNGNVVEIQGTAEGRAVPRAQIDQMIDVALQGIASIAQTQEEVLAAAGVQLSRLLIT